MLLLKLNYTEVIDHVATVVEKVNKKIRNRPKLAETALKLIYFPFFSQLKVIFGLL